MLAYSKLWLDSNGDHSWLHVCPRVFVIFQNLCSCCPSLATGPYELSLLVADDATVRSTFCGILRSASCADRSNVAHSGIPDCAISRVRCFGTSSNGSHERYSAELGNIIDCCGSVSALRNLSGSLFAILHAPIAFSTTYYVQLAS